MMPTVTCRSPLCGSLAGRRWCYTVLVTLSFALSVGTPVWAQGAAKPDEAPGANLLAWLLLLLPALVIIFFLIPVVRRQKRQMTQINRSLELSEESVRLANERVALQKQTNELLRQLIEKQSRF
jgi:type VI protein secretion system component VasK